MALITDPVREKLVVIFDNPGTGKNRIS